MQLKRSATIGLAVSGAVSAQRPTDVSICDYYTTAVLTNNTAANQLTLLTVLVNTVVIGNYTMPNVGITVPGILAIGDFNGTKVNLLPYFNGALASSNRGGSSGVSVNFLDGGGAAPLLKNMPADDMTSNQYFLLTHLYSFFGALLGCSKYGMAGFAAYNGQASMYNVHKFMDLDAAEVGYFISQVAMAGASLGVANSDLQAVGTALGGLFNVRCGPPTTAIPAQGPQLQSICIDSSCALSPNSSCDSYAAPVAPQNASTSMPSSTMGTMTGTATTSATAIVSKAAAAATGVSLAAAACGLAALLL
ncbi:hypothetical protein GQ53DRAFT_869866 [Thozetella sp. PMI_491]|nr:hypothetical protein GQ53DRAFT_869866 [Thozetella sp. PMI_491]